MIIDRYLCFIGLLFAFLSPVKSYAEISFYVSPGGDNEFYIDADNINDKENVEVTVAYDSTILTNPRVTMEGGTVTNTLNPNPGVFTFNANRKDNPLHSFEAHLSFDRTWDSQGGIFSVTGKITEPDGTISPSHTTFNMTNPSLFIATSSAGGTASTPENSVASEDAAASGNSADIRMNKQESVLQRFKEFRGEPTKKALVALFARNPADMLVQEPLVALSDGKTPVSIRIELLQKEGNTRNIAMSDAKLLQLQRDGEKGWVITALPNEGTWNACLIIDVDERRMEFPLVVAPPVKIEKYVNERNFPVALNRYLTAQAATQRNSDYTSRRYIDEYIFTANCLARGLMGGAVKGN